MEEFLNLTQIKTSLKEAILLDYYTAGFWWAREMNFSLMQLSGFMDLLNFTLENLSSKHMTLGDNLKELERALAGIGETESAERGDLNLFSIEQAKAIIDYLVASVFKNYKAYEYLFHSRGEEPVISNENEIELDQPAVSPSASATESQGSDKGDYLQESCPEGASSEVDAVVGVAAEDEKSAVCEIPNEIIGNLEGLLLVGVALSMQPEGSFPCSQQEVVPQLRTTPSSCAWAPRAWVCSEEWMCSVGMEHLQTNGSLFEGFTV
ncbi:ciliary-associated calcium-binding coiled-coil protein 1 isoform X2 [Parus major]|nr:ciliary-associated calcium-binding coiled-coil protein 1 isoform X2 [Parus major]XP_033371700.1 ciliary-associated calcium-binding coiled-coil protein 1 isoform X2 [Parus major]XP_033371701.1 ciliary-associated calcium-binding coiled-coil protein 1 isoform X2 [Parus major]XP_033371704.1 ciliary-associated calcium-binding coiled-coil protein 1 isoform X2 [Parus major]